MRIGQHRSDFLPTDSGLQPEGLHPARGVAPSGFRPLRKILDCSHPQVSGQCLSPSEAGHALTPATHLSLGRLLPHQQASRTQTHPQAINLWSGDIIRYYLQFPAAIPNPGVGIYALLSLSPLSIRPKADFSLDLHA